MLSTRPQSIQEVSEANSKHAEFGKTKKEVTSINEISLKKDIQMKEKLSVLNEQQNLLRAVSGTAFLFRE